MASVLRRVLVAKEVDEESEALGLFLHPHGSIDNLQVELTELSCEPPALPVNCEDEGRNSSQSLLEDALLYLVVRKFGATADSAGGKVILGMEQQVLARWGRQDVQQLQQSVEMLHELLLKSEWGAGEISTLSRVVKRLLDPRARQRFLAFSFQVLQQPKSLLDERFYDEAGRLLLLGVTDLWSAIRKDCAKTAALIVFGFPSRIYIDQFMASLLCVAIGSRSVSADKSQVTAWTEREGALLALSFLLRSIKSISTGEQPSTEEKGPVSQVKDDIKGILGGRQSPALSYRLGSHTLTQLPRCLVQTLKPAIYQCLRHDQLSVRQLAAQCLVEYASLCEEAARLLVFQEAISKLNRMNRTDNLEENETPEEAELLDAFEAEGFLDVLARLIPYLPSLFLLKHWKVVFPTLEKYVMHVASSVRQKSSSVVLALARLSLNSLVDQSKPARSASTEASLKLLVQMLLSLSKSCGDDSDLCWQRKEGRLLSIDVLMNVIGESLFTCGNESRKLLGSKPERTESQRQAGSVKNLRGFLWAHHHSQLATWVYETEEARTQQGWSLVQAINAWIVKKGGPNEAPSTSLAFWQQVLSGCITQTKDAFQSSQFELRRISRQLLPGLMRITVWTNQLEFLSSTELTITSAGTCWSWSCVKYILLHLRYLEESLNALGIRGESSASLKLKTDWKTVWKGILAMQKSEENNPVDAETIVAKVETQMMAFCCFGASADPSRHVTCFLDSALRLIHANLPETMQLRALTGRNQSTAINDTTLDRQLCVFLVPLLPAVAATLQHVAEKRGIDSILAESELSWSSRWLCLERIILSWLSSQDMFRWITLSKAEAQSQLLESLSIHLRFSMTTLPPVQEDEEIDRVAQCLAHTWATSGTRLKDATFINLMSVHLLLWLRSIKIGSDNTEEVAALVARLYSQRQQQLTASEAKAKPLTNSTESWDDWDEDEGQVQPATPVAKVEEAQSFALKDNLFQEVLESLDASQLNLLREATSALPSLAGVQDVPIQHIARMREQIQAHLCMK